MKIGILTIHTAHNFGSVYQAFALQEYLKQIGNQVEIINYRPDYLNSYRLFPAFKVKSLRKFIGFIIGFVMDPIVKWRHYFGFRKYAANNFERSRNAFSDSREIPDDYDAYVIGSDQIWNPDIMKYDSTYWGVFKHKADAKVISYAASMDARPLSGEECALYKKWLSHLSAISVREAVLIPLLQPLTSTKIHSVVDPTILVGLSPFEKQATRTNFRSKYGRYVLMYNVIDSDIVIQLANKVAEQKKAKVLRVKAFPSFNWHDGKYDINNVSPYDFLGIIRDAEAVVCSSFHGTVFSILYHKDYYTASIGRQGSRVSNLLNELGMNDRYITSLDNIPQTPIDYNSVENSLSKLRKQSEDYIKKSLYE